MILVLHVMTMSWPALMNILQKMLFSYYNLFICKPHFSGFDLSKSLLKTQAKLEFIFIKVHLIHTHMHTKKKQNIKQSNLKWRKEHSLLNYYWISSPKILVKKMDNLKCVNPCTRYITLTNQYAIFATNQVAMLMTFCMHPIGKVAYSINAIFGP